MVELTKGGDLIQDGEKCGHWSLAVWQSERKACGGSRSGQRDALDRRESLC